MLPKGNMHLTGNDSMVFHLNENGRRRCWLHASDAGKIANRSSYYRNAFRGLVLANPSSFDDGETCPQHLLRAEDKYLMRVSHEHDAAASCSI